MANEYFKGEHVRSRGTFTDENGNYVDPTDVFFKALDPTGEIAVDLEYGQDAALVRESQGVYRADVEGDEIGHWLTRMWSTGVGAAAAEDEFRIKSRF